MQTVMMTPAQIVDELLYRSYRFNRENAPRFTPRQWGAVFANVEQLETRYQKELKEEERADD